MKVEIDIEVTGRQALFLRCRAQEVLFGGAAGGGKSWAQIIDALVYALRYPASKQLVLRRTFPELEKSLIRLACGLYPRKVWRYNGSRHSGVFVNGSIIDFGHCDGEGDVHKYQSAEYDVIRFDELTHFTEWTYVYLMSRLRGANSYPKQMKSCTNPGGVGHAWVKARFVDSPDCVRAGMGQEAGAKRCFIPSRVEDNRFLMAADPGYVERLEQLPERERKALLHGDWDIFAGQYFPEFCRDIHVVRGYSVPAHWRVYRALDYGLDMLCCLWVAVDEQGRGHVFREVYEKDLIVSEAARAILNAGDERAEATLAPPDLWNRRQETGRSAADIFAENGLLLTKTSNERVAGWLCVKEALKVRWDGMGGEEPGLVVFEGCVNLIRALPALQVDAHNPSDAAREPHELTHAPDALRCFCVWWAERAGPEEKGRRKWSADYYEDWLAASAEERKLYF